MNVQFIPDGASSINDVINVHDHMTGLMKYARSKRTARKNQETCIASSRCEQCGQLARVEAHHIKPVWAYALQYLLDSGAQTTAEFGRVAWLARVRNLDRWHDLSNLIPLCAKCHDSTQSATDEEYKRFFEDNYPVVFGQRNLSEVLKRLK